MQPQGAFHLSGQKPAVAELPELIASTHPGESAAVKALMGFCLAIRRDVLDKHGLLCEETELGADDLELSWRLRELGGQLKIVLAHSSTTRAATASTTPPTETWRR